MQTSGLPNVTPCYMWMTFKNSMHYSAIASLLLFCFTCEIANAEVYKCVSADGDTKYQHSPCEVNEKSKKVILKGDATKAAAAHTKAALAECQHKIVGQWQQTHSSTLLDNKLIENQSQSWVFNSDGWVEQTGATQQKSKFICKGSTITFDTEQKSPVKIVRLVENELVLRSIDVGGYLYLQKK